MLRIRDISGCFSGIGNILKEVSNLSHAFEIPKPIPVATLQSSPAGTPRERVGIETPDAKYRKGQPIHPGDARIHDKSCRSRTAPHVGGQGRSI